MLLYKGANLEAQNLTGMTLLMRAAEFGHTKTVKVLLARYVWGRRLREEVVESIEQLPVIEESEAAAQP